MKLKLLDLFSGIGGFSLGLESTGYFETIAFVEKDKFCQQVLKKNFKDIPIESEVRDVKGERYAADIITGGFPCTPFSNLGHRKSTNDKNYLWGEMFRIIKEVKARWIIAENVSALANISNGEVLQGIYNDLQSCGYEIQTFNISARSQGANHKRPRLFILASNSDNPRCKDWNKQHWRTQTQSKERVNSISGQDIISIQSQWRKERWNKSKLIRKNDGVSYGLDKDRNNRIKSLGNSIVPLIARELGLAIMKAEQDEIRKTF